MTDFNKILDKAKELEAKMKESQQKIKEKEKNKKTELINKAKESEIYKTVLEKFSDANLVEVISKNENDK